MSMRLTEKEIRIVLSALADKYGKGYSENKEVAKLQSNLSMQMQMLKGGI